MLEKTVGSNTAQLDTLYQELKTMMKQQPESFVTNDNCIEKLFELFDDAADKTGPAEVSNAMLKIAVIFLARSKAEPSEEAINKYTYLIPKTFLCWSLFEYSYYAHKHSPNKNQKTIVQFVRETIETDKLNTPNVFTECDKLDDELSRVHYEAYKYLAGSSASIIYEHLKKIICTSNHNEK